MSEQATINDVMTELRVMRRQMVSGLLTRREAAEFLGVSVATLDRLRSSGEVPPPVAINGMVRYRKTDLDRYIEELRPLK